MMLIVLTLLEPDANGYWTSLVLKLRTL